MHRRGPAGLLVAGWAIVAAAMMWRAGTRSFPIARAAFQGPVEFTSAFAEHWGAIAVSFGWLALFWLAARASGTLLLRWIGRPDTVAPREASVAKVLLGFGFYGCFVVASGLVGLFFRPVPLVRLVVLAAAGIWLFTRALARRPRPDPWRRDTAWLAAAALAAAGTLLVFSLTPETWSDSLQYHLAAPQDFNKLHKWVDFDQDTYRYPLLAEGIFGQGLLIGGEQLAMRLNVSGSVLVLWLLWAWARRVAGPVAAWLAVLSMLVSDQVGFHIGQTNQGMYAVAFATLAVWAWTTGGLSGRSRRWSMLTGVGLGWAMCCKYTAAAPGVGILAWHLARAVRRPGQELATLGWIAAGGAVAASPFLLNGWLFTGNPVYPLFFGGLHWTPENTRVLNEFGCVGYDFSVREPRTMIRAASRLVTEEQPLLLLALPALAGLRGGLWLPLAVAWTGAVAAWSVGVPCLRLMLPVFPALSLVAAAAIAPWWEAAGPRGTLTRLATATLLALGFVATVGVTDFHHRSFNAGLGLESEARYLARILTTYQEATREVNRMVPARDRLLVIGDARGWRFAPLEYNRDVEDTPVMLELSRQAADPAGLRKVFRQMGARWVLLNHVTSEYMSPWWNDVQAWRLPELGRAWEFWRTYGEIVWRSSRPDGRNGGFILYRLRDRPGTPARRMPFLPGAEGVGVARGGETVEDYLARMEATERAVPGIAFYYARVATKYLAAGRPADALRTAARGLTPDYPELDVLHGLRGLALERLHRFAEAADAFARAASLHPEEPNYERRRRACVAAATAPRIPTPED